MIGKLMDDRKRETSLENNENKRKMDPDSTTQNLSQLNDKKLHVIKSRMNKETDQFKKKRKKNDDQIIKRITNSVQNSRLIKN